MPPLSCPKQTVTQSSTDVGQMNGSIASFSLECRKEDCNKEDVSEIPLDTSNTFAREDVSTEIVWKNVIILLCLHAAAPYGMYLMFTSAMWQTNLFAVILDLLCALGVSAGVHRLWSHRSYKAKLPLRIFLAFAFTLSFQSDIFDWTRDHRVHHKYSETNADPYNATRGFFFSHIGWLFYRKHPEVIKKGKAIDFSDLEADPVVRFHRKYNSKLVLFCCFGLPTFLPMYLWGETFLNSFFVTIFRLCCVLNQTWLVNSAAHMWGNRPYDVHINPRENFMATLGSMGEGFHNYHHTFPYDYATSEYGMKYNLGTCFINCMAWLGQAYDLKTVSPALVAARRLRTGEPSIYKKE